MKYRFFKISAFDSEQAEQALNTFYAQHRIISVDKHFVADGCNSFWVFCLSFTDSETGFIAASNNKSGKSKIDYRDVFNEADFSIYAQLRDLRKTLAERDGVPPYALFTNEQLAKMVQLRITSKKSLLELDGVGQARIDKYAEAFLNLLATIYKTNADETSTHQS